jgi:hypothetical protein
MQLVGATKLQRWKIARGTTQAQGYKALVWKHTLTTLGSGRGEGVPAVVESDICNTSCSQRRTAGVAKGKRTQRSSTVHIILEFGCVERMVR